MEQLPQNLTFDGTAYDATLDKERLTNQAYRVYAFMSTQRWHTLREIAEATGAPEASASACLRDFRKPRWNWHTVEKRRRGEPSHGCWEYRVMPRVVNMEQGKLF